MRELKRYMERSGKTQKEIAELLGVSQPTVCDWVNGHITPEVKNLMAISKLTGKTVDDLLRGRSVAA